MMDFDIAQKDSPRPDPVREARDRELVITYQASYLAEAFGIPMARALELVKRYGVQRQTLMKGVATELGMRARKLRIRRPGRKIG